MLITRQITLIATALTAALVMDIPLAVSDDHVPVPAVRSQVTTWFRSNVKPYAYRRGLLDPGLEAAEARAKVVRVRKDGLGDFRTVREAVDGIPAGNDRRVIVWIGGGEYNEKIRIDRTKPFVTFYGSPGDMPKIVYDGTAAEYGTVDSATLIVESDYFMAANIIIANSAPRPDGKRPGAQAVALRISGDKAAFYNCRMLGFQDTICDDRGFHFFKDCYIEGTVDFIFGSGTSLYLTTMLNVLGGTGLTVITAQARETNEEDTGYSFVHCTVTGTGTGAYLGRAWMTSPRVIFSYSDMSQAITPAGWFDNFHPERARTVEFGEHMNTGPGSDPGGRAKFVKQLSAGEVQPFISLRYIEGSTWLLPPPTV